MYTYYAKNMNITLSIPDDLIQEALHRADAMGTSVNQLIREYLEDFTGKSDLPAVADELRRLSLTSGGDARGWKFDREELHKGRYGRS